MKLSLLTFPVVPYGYLAAVISVGRYILASIFMNIYAKVICAPNDSTSELTF